MKTTTTTPIQATMLFFFNRYYSRTFEWGHTRHDFKMPSIFFQEHEIPQETIKEVYIVRFIPTCILFCVEVDKHVKWTSLYVYISVYTSCEIDIWNWQARSFQYRHKQVTTQLNIQCLYTANLSLFLPLTHIQHDPIFSKQSFQLTALITQLHTGIHLLLNNRTCNFLRVLSENRVPPVTRVLSNVRILPRKS